MSSNLKVGDVVRAERDFLYGNGVKIRKGELLKINQLHFPSNKPSFKKDNITCFLPVSTPNSFTVCNFVKSPLWKVLNGS